MRKRWVFTLAAGQSWPEISQGSGGPGAIPKFNWVRVDNVGANPLDVTPGRSWGAADYTRIWNTVSAGKVRVFNVAGPKDEPDDQWWSDIFIYSALGTTFILEVSDNPIIDLPNASPASAGVSPSGAQIVQGNPSGQSLYAEGSVTTPAALTTIAAIAAAPPAGFYDLTFNFVYGATGDVAANVKAFWNGGGAFTAVLPNPQGAGAQMSPVTFRRVQIDGGHSIGLESLAAGAAGSVYIGSVTATPVS